MIVQTLSQKYINALTVKSSAEMAPVKAVWMLAHPLGRPCVCTRTHGLRVLIKYKIGLREKLSSWKPIGVCFYLYLLYIIFRSLSMTIMIQLFTIFHRVLCAIYTL